MNDPPQAPTYASPAGCALAIAISVLIVGGAVLAFSLLTGRQLDLEEESGVLLFQVLLVAAPFLLLALAGVRRRAPWLTGLALTLAFWSYYVFEGVSYQRHPDGSGANIGLGLLMMASPVFITAAIVAVHVWHRSRGRRRG